MNRQHVCPALGFLAALCIGTHSVHAITTLIAGGIGAVSGPPTANYGYPGAFQSIETHAQTNTASVDVTSTGPNPTHIVASSTASADEAGAHVKTFSSVARTSPVGPVNDHYYTFNANGRAIVLFDDVFVSGSGTAPIATRFSVVLDGVLSAAVNPNFDAATGSIKAQSSVQADLRVNGVTVKTASHQLSVQNGSDAISTGFGGLEYFTGYTVLTSDEFMVTPDMAISVVLDLTTKSAVTIQNDGSGEITAENDFSNTLSFVDDRPIFDLPVGYTVNSESAGIVNNRLVGSTPPVVPEPTSMVMLLLAAPFALTRFRRA